MDRNLTTLEFPKILEMICENAACDMTREKIRAIRPVSDLAAARREMEKTQDAFSLSQRFGAPSFFKILDMRGLLQRAQSGSCLSFGDFLEIAAILRQAESLETWYGHCENSATSLDDDFLRLAPVPYLLEKIDRSVISPDEIADAASPKLAEIRRKIRQSRQKLRDTLENIMRQPSVQDSLQEARVTMRDGRYVLPVRVESRAKVPGFIHDTSSSGQTVFIEPTRVVEANNDIRLFEMQESQEIERIRQELSEDCGSYADAIIADIDVSVSLGVIFAKARLAQQMKAAAPILTDDGKISLINARHPLLPINQAVPISFSLGGDTTALLITGPNTGGKTVALKTCGLLTLMAMSGIMIPASERSSISIFAHVLADIGDTQSIEENLSTFSSSMRCVINILEIADEHSLVLLDELCSGTDPVEGAALAQAIIRRLQDNGARLMVTTHYPELKIYATQTPDAENASCVFDMETMRPTYRLQIGVPGKSNAFAISEGLGLSKAILQSARSLVDAEDLRFETAIENLENARKALEEDRLQLRKSLLAAREDAEKARQQREVIERESKKQIEDASARAAQIIEQTKAQANELVTELEKLRKEKDKASFSNDVLDARGKVKRGFRDIYKTANPVTDSTDTDSILPRDLEVGDSVQFRDTGQKATVCGKPDRDGNVLLQVGAMKMRVPQNQLKLNASAAQKEKQKEKERQQRIRNYHLDVERSGSMELDLHGYTCDEAILALDAFLDRAVVSNIRTVTIIHGKGTGKLRQAVHRRLKQLPYVESFRAGGYGEGDTGVTVVTLK